MFAIQVAMQLLFMTGTLPVALQHDDTPADCLDLVVSTHVAKDLF